MKKEDSISKFYKNEFNIINKAETILEKENINIDKLKSEYLFLLNNYKKLLKQSITITKISDNTQHNFLRTTVKIEQQKEQLKKEHEELVESYTMLEQVAHTDPLTKLPNRRAFMDKVNQVQNCCRDTDLMSFIIIADIDDFKKVNDRYGHDCGDYVLVTISQKMLSCLRKSDFLGRWGGEEFIILLPYADTGGGISTIERIRSEISNAVYKFDGQEIKVTMTFGICEFRSDNNIDDCIRRADKALYQGKKNGKNCFVIL